jgi:cytochrome c-type biogenesis protein CcmH/NrfG
MARGAAKQRPRPAKAEVRPRAARKPPVAEQTMFFMKLRRSTKPVFLFLAFVFALSFVFLGVGSGSTGLGDLLNGNLPFFGHGSSGTSIGKAESRVKKHPNDPAAYRDLARAYEAKSKTDQAITALDGYLRLRPKDTDALGELAGLYLSQAEKARNQAIAAQAALSASGFNTIAPTSGRLSSAIGQDPITAASSGQANTAFTSAYQKMQGAYTAAVGAYKRVAAASPRDPSVQLQLAQTAENAGDTTTAVAAYKKFLRLAPDDPNAPTIKQHLKQIEPKKTLGKKSTR